MATDKESLTARFRAMRFNDNKHLGLGDVRLTLWEQEQIEKEFADLEARLAVAEAERDAAQSTIAELRGQVERMREALAEAIESVEDWAGYASEYFRQKHGLKEELARFRATFGDAS